MSAGQSVYQAKGFHDDLPKGKVSGEIRVTTTSLQFNGADQSVTLPISGIQFKLGGASDRLLFASHPNVPDWSLYTSDLTILRDPQLSQVPSIRQQLNKARGRRWFNWSVAILCVVLIVVGPLSLLGSMEWISKQVAKQVPPEWETQLGQRVFAQYQVNQQMLQNGEGKTVLLELAQPLLEQASTQSYSFTLAIVNAPEVNAFALPGGFIVINSGLIMEADNASEVLGVLAHEMAHVTEQHGIRNIISAAGIFLLFDALLGDVSGVLAVLADAAPLLINQSYSRQFESDADKLGFHFLVAADIDPSGLVTFFEKLKQQEQQQLAAIEDEETRDRIQDSLGFISSHPATEQRIENLRALLENQSGPYQNHDALFEQLKQQVQTFVANHEDGL